MNLWHLTLLILAAISCSLAEGTKKSKKEIESDIDEFIEAVLECQSIPGINLAIVNNGEAYLSKGYGVKDLETMEPLTNKTLLVIASVTKQFVSTVVGLMLDESEGAATWNTPVRDVLGDWFYFHESHRTTKATIRDLLSHQIGIPGHNEMRHYGYTTRELMEKLRFLEFSQEWREVPQYNNLMYGLASYVAETLAGGTSWEDLARSRLFAPLGMDATTFVHQAKDRWDEFAKGYQVYDESGELREVSLEVAAAYYGTISAPGGVSTNAEDMIKWLMMHLSDGQNQDGEQVVPSDVLQEVHVPVNVLPVGPGFTKPLSPVSYTLEKWASGWMEGYYREFKRSTHSGSRDGYRSLLNLLPDLNIGVFTSINRVNSVSQDLIQMYIIDLLMGEDPWVDLEMACNDLPLGTEDKHADELQTEEQNDKQQKADEDYVGVYGDYAYGNATVFINETSGLLSLSYGAVEWTLTGTVADRFSAQGLDPFWYWTMTVTFDRSDDVVTEMTLPFQTGANPTFVRGRDMSTAPPPPELCN